jgi:transposase-like protein
MVTAKMRHGARTTQSRDIDRHPLVRRARPVRDGRFEAGGFFDAADVIQVKYEMLRSHRVDGRSVAEVAALFGVSRQTVYNVARDFDAYGLLGLSPAKPKRKRGPRGGWKYTPEIVAYAARRRRARRRPSFPELAREVEQRFAVRVNVSGLRGVFARSR